MENPVRSPMVPPIADNMSTNFAALSLVILSKIGVSKYILSILNLFFHWKSKEWECEENKTNRTIHTYFSDIPETSQISYTYCIAASVWAPPPQHQQCSQIWKSWSLELPHTWAGTHGNLCLYFQYTHSVLGLCRQVDPECKNSLTRLW